MAKAAGGAGQAGHSDPQVAVTTFAELVSRLEQLAKAQEVVRALALGDDPDYAVAFERLFAAVALLNPLHAAGELAQLGATRTPNNVMR